MRRNSCGQRGADVRSHFAPANIGRLMKFAGDRPYSNPEATARKLVEIANSVEAVQDGRIFVELVNRSFLFDHKPSPAEYKAGLDRAIINDESFLENSR
jgi:hypothetical protein